MVVLNPKYKAFGNDSRYFIVTGGRGSGKSYSINLLLLLLTYETNHVILFTRYTLTSAHVSIIPEFIDKIDLLDKHSDFHITKDEIINLRTGSKILFKGIKTSSGTQTANLKSLAGVTTWVLDEAEELTDEDTFDKIDYSIRHKDIQNRVILILNPATKEHFIYQKFFESRGVEAGVNMIKGDTTYIHTTYKDNIDNLSESFLNQIKTIKERRPDKYKHTILGGWLDKAEGVIFTNWNIGKFNNDNGSVFGQDYGFSTDPSTLVETSIDKTRKIIYVRLHIYQTGLTTSQLAQLNKQFAGNNLIVADNAEPRLITELKAHGLNIVPTIKGADSVKYGISLLQDYDLIIDENSVDLIKELNNYCWLEKKSETPIDKYNHCFTGDTLVSTINGEVKIKDIKVGDLVLTSNGYQKVLKTFNNGMKQVNKYSMQFDTFSVSLCSTKEHKIKTDKEWKKISELQKDDVLYRYKYSTEKNIDFTMVKDILVEAQRGYTLRFGNITTEVLKKDTMFTMLTETRTIITLKILILFMEFCILGSKVKRDSKRILSGLKTFTQKVLRKQKNGTSQTKAENGTKNMVKNAGLIERKLKKIVWYAEKNTKHHAPKQVNSVIKTAKLKTLEQGESYKAEVYDIMVENNHEYFANGILVHNCVDALRYAVSYQLANPNKGKYGIR